MTVLKNVPINLVCRLIVGVLTLLIGNAPRETRADELIFEQTWDNLANYDSTLTPNTNREVADDFDLQAEITRVVAGGTSVAPDSVWVRFFAGTPNGPGELLAEYFFDADDPDLIINIYDSERFDITLPEPFVANGHHYVSVQPVASGPWFWWNAELETAGGTPAYSRVDGGSWSTVQYGLDVCYSLYGTLLGPGQLDSLSETTLTRSGFLEIFGSGLGSTGEVLIGGHPAITTSWSDERIVAYVPEATGPGVVPVQVIHEGGASNTLDLEVTLRQAEGRKLWRLRMDALYSLVRPAVGPSGTIYAVDVYDRLYAVSPDGELLWLVEQAGSKGVDVDANGIIYTGNENWIKAFNPDGTLRWTYLQNPVAFLLPDVAVGPDGNIYALATNGLGVFSLTPDGVMRWATPEPYDQPIVVYTEIVFGPGSDGSDQLYFHANRHTRAIRLEDGAPIFELDSAGEHAVSPVDNTLHSSTIAYLPNGNVAWEFNEFLNGTPSIGNSGIHYSTSSLVIPQVYAVNVDGSERWNAVLDDNAYKVDVNPAETLILLGTYDVLTTPAAFLGVDTSDGETLWRFELPVEDPEIPNSWTGGMGFNQFVDSRAAFRSDSSAAYAMTAIATGGATTDRCFLYALDTNDSVTVTIPVDNFNVFRGTQIAGELSDILLSDDSYLKFNPGITLSSAEPPVWLEFEGTLPSDVPASLSVTLEAHANTVGLAQTIEMFNWNSGQYEQVDSRATSFNADSVATVDVSASVSDYVLGGSGSVKTRMGWRPNGPIFLFPWTVSLDQVIWSVE